MIYKLYEVVCNKCGVCINHYIGNKPTPTELRLDKITVRIRNGKILTYCNKCAEQLKLK